MPVSPQDYALWAEATGNPYPKTKEEKARLAPEVYDFNRGFGKFRGFDEVQGYQADVVYDQPISIRHYGDNTLLQSPITPDNNIPKVAGQLNSSLTGQHYSQHYADDAYETGFGGTDRPRSLLEKAAIGALGVGAAAAGVYGAQKLTGRDLGVGRVGGVVRDLGQRAKSGIKSMLGLAKEAADPSFVTREGAENVLAVAQHGTSAIDDVAPGIVRGQNVVPVQVRATQASKSRIPDPWGESALGSAGQTVSAPAQQSVVGTQTSGAGFDSDIQSRISQFKTKHASLFGTPEGAPYNQQTFFGPTSITPVLGQADEAYANLVRSAGPPRKTVLSGIDPQTKKPYSTTVLRSELMGSGQPLVTVPGKVGTVSVSSPVPERPSILGSYPGPEGSSGQGVQFTALQGMAGGRPYRYSILPAERRIGETITEFVQRPVQIDGRWSTQYDPVSVFQNPIENEGIDTLNRLKGLLAPQRPLHPGALSEVQRTFSTDPRAATVQKQAEAIFQATGDPSVIRSAYGTAPGLPIRVTLPSGESVPTGSLYEAFGQVVNTKTGVPVTTARAESLQAALNMQSQMQARALNQLGLPSTYQLSQSQLQQLDPRTQKLLGETAAAVRTAQAGLAQAEANPLLYKLKPEITQGIREVPVISETTGQVVGSRVVPETEGLPTSQYYKMRAAGGAGRQETGGIGRRREALMEGADELGFNIAPGSMEDVSPVLYQIIDDTTGQAIVVQPHEVSPMQLLSGAAKPIRGTAVEPQRIMGREGRTYKGVASNVVDPGSFDPAMLSQIAEGAPERLDPATGLAYSVQAMGGKERAAMAAEQEALRQAGRYKESVQLGKKMAQAQTQRVLPGAQEGPIFTGMSNQQLNETVLQARNAGALDVEQAAQNVLSARAEQAEKAALMQQRSQLVKQALSGELGKLPQVPISREFPFRATPQLNQPPLLSPAAPQPSATIRTTREFVPTQLSIPGVGLAPAIQSNPALETAIATEQYMGTRPGQKMKAAMQKALSKAATRQPELF